MEKNFRLLLGCIFMILLLNACSSETAYVREEAEGIEEIAKFVPFDIKVDGAKAIVSFVQTPAPFEVDLTADRHTEDIRLIESVIGVDTPLRIFVYKGTHSIAKVEAVTQQEILDYRKNLVRTDSDIMNRPDPQFISIFPDEAMLEDVYYIIRNQACHPAAPMEDCLTFQFASDGCNARAHKMKQILNTLGYNCQKHYVFGNLFASTATCCVQWVYHTAPLVQVRNNSGVVEERILDPSLFITPVTPEVWRAACQNMVCVLNPDFEFVPATYKTVPGIVFQFNPSSMSFSLDSDYFKTNCTLNVYRSQAGCGFPTAFPPDNCQN